MASILLQIQQDLTDRLLADPFFADIPVLSRKKKETLNDIQNRINRLSVAVMVLIPSASIKYPNIPGPFFDEIRIQVGVCENRLVNATGKDAEEIAEHVAALLHHYRPENVSESVVCDTPTIVEIAPETEADRNKRLLAVNFITGGGLSLEIPQVATPLIVDDAGEISISTDTVGAAIFYTTDGNHPSPRTGNLYTAPFSPGDGVTINTRAWLAGYLASDLASHTT